MGSIQQFILMRKFKGEEMNCIPVTLSHICLTSNNFIIVKLNECSPCQDRIPFNALFMWCVVLSQPNSVSDKLMHLFIILTSFIMKKNSA